MVTFKRISITLLVSIPFVFALYENGTVIAPCDSPVYCHGDILHEIELAQPFTDSKTFVDLPTIRPLDEVIAAFGNLSRPITNNSDLNDFLTTYFGEEGTELEEVPRESLSTHPVFLDRVNDTVISEFVEKVIDIWPDLTRQYVGRDNCTGCVDSFIPVNRSFVVAGGRFREPYYWDSFWVIEGLLRTQGNFTEIAKNIIENFLDLVDTVGFVPNGARIYYLNRSQPPLLSFMVDAYVQYTKDTSIVERALPLLIKEHDWWMTNRTIQVSAEGETYTLNRYAVTNTQPRPESYREDYVTANNQSYYAESGIIYPTTPLDETEKVALYANLASGAESGWDYTTRWLATPSDALRDMYFPLRSLNNYEIVPVDLNSILYGNELVISKYLSAVGNETGATHYANLAQQRSDAIYALMWNSTYNSFFDYNLTSSSPYMWIPAADDDATAAETAGAPPGSQLFFHAGQFYPFWTGAAPPHLKNNPLAVSLAYTRVAQYLDDKAGAIPATNLQTGQQWDQPNVWPPLIYILLKGLLNTPASFGAADDAYQSVRALAGRLAQRYLDSTFCTWRATGGSTSETPKLDGLAAEAEGIMFEKYADNATNVAGSGGEYEVVEGFGWTNGVLIWVADTFAEGLTRPECGELTPAHLSGGGARRAVELDPRDGRWVRKFGKRNRD
ncbi:trehalase-like protein [Eremomyces bilateralis CBS 781.70]|uniref:Trehalase n=1 Tax=Eremomyces bilateralis CBS 781.70 TaxID=1392243 RepID=A0A6G1GFX0_9PEZI|nr:trehalase-like protein [Eremomyces bilateralis CBS 781.70]KAF1816924.1 trehalase-like protein [Eremomyces bilateralis CBS 781.70]